MYKVILISLILLNPLNSKANGISLIEDYETKSLLLEISRPIFKVAKLDSDDLIVNIVQNPDINAFVYLNQIFVNTGLIMFSSNPDVLYGVLAHEVGHVAKMHLSRMVFNSIREQEKMVSFALLVAVATLGVGAVSLLGISAGVIFIPAAVLTSLVNGNLQYSRDNEREADDAGIHYLKQLNKNSTGMYRIMSYFDSKSNRDLMTPFKYMFTHPLPMERMRFINETGKQTFARLKEDCDLKIKLQMIRSKMQGYFGDSAYYKDYEVDDFYCKNEDFSLYAQYYLVHKKWKEKDTQTALQLLNKMIEKDGNNIFLLETKSNILLENGDVREAIDIKRNISKKTNEDDLKLQLAFALIIEGSEANLQEAVKILHLLFLKDIYKFKSANYLKLAFEKLNNSLLSNFYQCNIFYILKQKKEGLECVKNTKKMLEKDKNKIDKKISSKLEIELDDIETFFKTK